MFFPKVLQISNIKTQFVHDPVALLQYIIKRFVQRIPFQNITSMGSVHWENRQKPNMQTVLSACLQGSGGLCGHNNYFMKLALESIGYETIVVPGVFRRTGVPSSHLALLIRIPYKRSVNQYVNTETNNLYLVDVGCGVPIHEPVLISNLVPYKSRAGGLEFYYETTPDGNFRRVNLNGDALVGQKDVDYLSPQDYEISLNLPHVKDTDWSGFDKSFKEIYTNPNSVYLHHGFYLFRYLSISESDFEIVWIRGTQLILATRDTRTATSFNSFQEVKPLILKYFPMIPQDEVERAVYNYTNQVIPKKLT